MGFQQKFVLFLGQMFKAMQIVHLLSRARAAHFVALVVLAVATNLIQTFVDRMHFPIGVWASVLNYKTPLLTHFPA